MVCGSGPDTYESLTLVSQGTYHTVMTSSSACPIFTYNALIAYLVTYRYIFGPIFMLIGLFMALAGRKFFKVAVILIGGFIVTFFILTICYQTFLQTASQEWVNWLTVGLSIALGLACGFIALKLERFGACMLAGWAGFCIGVLLNESVLYLA